MKIRWLAETRVLPGIGHVREGLILNVNTETGLGLIEKNQAEKVEEEKSTVLVKPKAKKNTRRKSTKK